MGCGEVGGWRWREAEVGGGGWFFGFDRLVRLCLKTSIIGSLTRFSKYLVFSYALAALR